MTLVSIAAGGVAKALVAVTISLHPGAAQPARHHIMVARGDSLSAISLHEYGTAAKWPALWWANQRQVPDPSMIVPGERLTVPSGLRVSRWLVRAAQAATAASRHARPVAMGDTVPHRARPPSRRAGAELTHATPATTTIGAGPQLRAARTTTERDAATASTGPTPTDKPDPAAEHQRKRVPTEPRRPIRPDLPPHRARTGGSRLSRGGFSERLRGSTHRG